ncbi:Uma2 family endonuclease [Nocardia miyunensis]|uniref:Uma2 family endonuclease n=1 Tax=Nocardia miyunensis TaxID=282684 RepID=UPI00350E4355
MHNRRPDVVVYRADTIDIPPTRPEHVLLVAEVVSPGSETTDRIVKVEQYARAGIGFCRRVEQAATGVPLIYTYVLDPARGTYRPGRCSPGRSRLPHRFRWRSTWAGCEAARRGAGRAFHLISGD